MFNRNRWVNLKKYLNNLVRFKFYNDEIFEDIIGFSLKKFLDSTKKRKTNKKKGMQND